MGTSIVHRSLAAAILLAVVVPSMASAAGVDWKMYGGTGNQYCFYEERGVQRSQSLFIRVWTKCLLESDLDTVDTNKPYYRAVVDMSAQRVVHHYVPPWLMIKRGTFAQALHVSLDEAIADVGDLTAQAQIFYELDCKHRKLRELQITISSVQSTDVPTNWKDVPPEGNGANLLTLLCPA